MLRKKINNWLIIKLKNLHDENKILRKELEEKRDIEKKYIDKIHLLQMEMREIKLNDKKYYID